mgnify:CR=1 FL=1
MTSTLRFRLLAAIAGSFSLLAAGAGFAEAPIIKPGKPGEAATELSAEQAIEIANTSYSPADVRFMTDMIPHHHQALEMAELVADRTNRQELIDVAGRINASLSLVKTNSSLSPVPTISFSRIALGMVICPLLVMVAIAMVIFLTFNFILQNSKVLVFACQRYKSKGCHGPTRTVMDKSGGNVGLRPEKIMGHGLTRMNTDTSVHALAFGQE